MERIGISVTTWKRPELFLNLMDRLSELDDRFYFSFIFDGPKTYEYDFDDILKKFNRRSKTYQFVENVGVSRAKNVGIRLLKEFNVDYYFLLDDDIDILNLSVFDYYIATSKITGIKHFMFLHIPPNKITSTMMFNESVGITTHEHAQGAFMMFTADHLLEIGEFDNSYHNALEHVDMTYRSYTRQNLPFWYFIDVLGSEVMLKERGGESTITNKNGYEYNKLKSSLAWVIKYKHSIADIPKPDLSVLVNRLKQIKK